MSGAITAISRALRSAIVRLTALVIGPNITRS